MNKPQLIAEYPAFQFIEELTPQALTTYLRGRDIPALQDVEVISNTSLGDGNMNTTRLLETSAGDLVLKQSVPWVAKYPAIPAPWDRSIREATFYRAVAETESVTNKMPQLIDVDLGNRTLLFTYEPGTVDCSVIYSSPESLTPKHAEAAALWLANLHAIQIDPERAPMIANRDMRSLNYEHIFEIPFQRLNGLDLDAITPGLQNLRDDIIADGRLAKQAHRLGEAFYQKDGTHLIHGDFFPGSWLKKEDDIYVIDPEFAFMGHTAFDISVALAHFKMAGCSDEIAQHFVDTYQQHHAIDNAAVKALAGIEILRRLNGVAQLPLEADLEQKREWIEQASRDVLEFSAE